MPCEPSEERSDLEWRLRCTAGHLKGVADMLRTGASCDEVFAQALAARGSLEEINQRLARLHLKTCLFHAWREGGPADQVRAAGEVLIFYKLLRGHPSRIRKDIE
jgi:DNA-binding FrmR family transcriptional regulator